MKMFEYISAWCFEFDFDLMLLGCELLLLFEFVRLFVRVVDYWVLVCWY